MTLQEFLVAVGTGRKHKWYARVNELRSLYVKMITGEGVETIMQRFNPRENTEEFAQRKRITKHITKTVARGLIKPQYKVPRSNGVIRTLQYKEDKQESKKKEFEKIIGKFWGNESLDKWMQSRWIELNNIDPNAFVVLEWKDFNAKKETASPYPFEVSSEAAILYEYQNNILQYLVAENKSITTVIDDGMMKDEVYRIYTHYDKVGATVLKEVLDKKIKAQVFDKFVPYNIAGRTYYKVNETDVYELIVPKPYNLDFVPAIRVGYVRDLFTDGDTRLNPIDDAMPILEKLVKANSELDLTMALHVFPQKFQYVPRCDAPNCTGGELPDGSSCKKCGGTGLLKHTTAQDSIDLKLPRTKEEMVTLSELVHYESPPVDLVRFQTEYIDSLIEKCKKAIYNSEIFSRQQVAETATGKNIDLQNVYDSLYSLAQGFSEVWRFMVYSISKITDMDEGLVYDYVYPKDFKMKSLTELYLDLKTVSDSKADPFVKSHLYDDIALIIFQDNSRELDMYKMKREFFPFSGKSEDEILYIVGSDLTTRFNKVFWANEATVYDEVILEYSEKGIDFLDLDRPEQWKAIKAKVEEYIGRADKTEEWTGANTLMQEQSE